MNLKKNPRKKLENFSKIFFQIGLVLALFVIYKLAEYKTYERKNLKNFRQVTMTDDLQEDIPIIEIQKIKPPSRNTPTLVEKIRVVEDEMNIEETIIESTETDEDDAIIINTEDIVEVEEVEEVVEDIPFMLIETVPIYPGCKGNNNKLKACFTKKIAAFFGSKFDVDLASELGLSEGKKKLFVVFKIDKTGKVTDVRAKGPHPRLEKEVVTIINSLPKMIPGKQRGKPVGVSYSLPITFVVE
jgi:protein TonB